MKDYGAAVKEAGPIIQMKGRDGGIAIDLHLHVPGLNVHKGSGGLIAANLLENDLEGLFIFGSAVGPLRECSGIEDSGIIRERVAEPVPVKVVEGLDKGRQESLNLGL
jgi:hypothetical protein